MKKKNMPLIIAILVAAFLLLSGLLFAGSFLITKALINVGNYSSSSAFARNNQEDSDEGDADEKQADEKESEDSLESGYYEFQDAVVNNLDYRVEWKEYNYQGDADMKVHFTYPEIVGDTPHIKEINKKIYAEIEGTVVYMEQVYAYEHPQVYGYEGTVMVTYMDEDRLSMIFDETEQEDDFTGSYLISMNFDMNSGLYMDNASLITIDDEFVVDFRNRSRKQNGTMEQMDALSDEQIKQYLMGDITGVVFYTPMGMEIGFNFPGGWVTVTYKDYAALLRNL